MVLLPKHQERHIYITKLLRFLFHSYLFFCLLVLPFFSTQTHLILTITIRFFFPVFCCMDREKAGY